MKFSRKILQKTYPLVSRCSFATNSSSVQRDIGAYQFRNVAKPSYIHGSASPKLLGVTMGQIIDAIPDRFGDNEVVVDKFHGIRKTFVEFKKEVDAIAAGFLALNLQRGDRIGIWCPNRYEWMLAQMAAAKTGLVLATVNPAFQKPEFLHILTKLELKAVLIQETFKNQNYYDMISDIIPEVKETTSGKINSKKYPYFTDIIMITDKTLPGVFKFNDLYSAGGSDQKRQLEQLQKEIQIDDAFNIQFTSGTTGKPKGATLTHNGVVNNCNIIANRMGYYEEQHRISCNVPLFHCFGCVLGTYITMLCGATCVFPSPSFDPTKMLQAIEEEKCTSIYGTPTMLIDVLNHPNLKTTNISSVKTGLMAGASVPPDLYEKVVAAFKASGIMIGYGCTETSPIVTLQHHTEPSSKKFDNVGTVIPNVEVKVVDTCDRIVPLNTLGEVCARGYVVTKGYWNDLEKTKESIVNGWYHTGDLGILSEEGKLKIVGRIKDMIIRGGENIYPKEIEDFLITHPKIFDAQVIGVPDERMGEEVCVWIQLKENEMMSESELKQFCKGNISHFKIPRYIRFVEDFPKTVSGKIQKFKMREEMNQILNKN